MKFFKQIEQRALRRKIVARWHLAIAITSYKFLVVPVLTYLLTKEDLSPDEVNGHAIDVVSSGVDTVSKNS